MCGHQVRSYGPCVTADDRTTAFPGEALAADHTGIQQYEIRVKGHIGSRWSAWFDGLCIATEDDGTTVIRGPLVDQAALHGVLQKVRDVGIPLISVTQLPPDAATEPPAPDSNEGN